MPRSASSQTPSKSAAYALKLATAYDMTNDIPVIQQRLQLYENDQPFRQSFLYTNTPAKGIRAELNQAGVSASQRSPHVRIFQSFRGGKISSQPRQSENPFGVEKFREQRGVGGRGGVPFWRGHQNEFCFPPEMSRQRFQREQNLIDHAQPVWRDDQRRRAQAPQSNRANRNLRPSGLNKPPAPSTSRTSKRFCIARTCASTCASLTVLFSRRAASNGAIGARKCHGLISSSDSAPSIAARNARASARPPEQTGFSAAALTPRSRRKFTSNAVKTVLPAPVSVPVMNKIRFNSRT